MTYDLMVFDPTKAPRATLDDFWAWHLELSEWDEDHSYDDVTVAAPALQGWYRDMLLSFPAMNGPDAVATESLDVDRRPRRSDYRIAHDAIYVDFHRSELEDARNTALRLAYRHGVGFFDLSGGGDVVFPNGDKLSPEAYPTLAAAIRADTPPGTWAAIGAFTGFIFSALIPIGLIFLILALAGVMPDLPVWIVVIAIGCAGLVGGLLLRRRARAAGAWGEQSAQTSVPEPDDPPPPEGPAPPGGPTPRTVAIAGFIVSALIPLGGILQVLTLIGIIPATWPSGQATDFTGLMILGVLGLIVGLIARRQGRR